MFPTRLLRRVIHYIWECYRDRGEIKIRLKNYHGHELQVEEDSSEWTVTTRYFARQVTGLMVKEMEAVCFIQRDDEWIPIEVTHGNHHAHYGRGDTNRGDAIITDGQAQREAAIFCDTWAMRLLEQGFLVDAAKHHPLTPRPAERPKWPQPTMPTPSLEEIEEWVWESGGCYATDGAWVEVDGVSPDGHPSWLLRLGLV